MWVHPKIYDFFKYTYLIWEQDSKISNILLVFNRIVDYKTKKLINISRTGATYFLSNPALHAFDQSLSRKPEAKYGGTENAPF